MKYNFDKKIDRRGTSSVKWEFIQKEDDFHQVEHTDAFFGENPILPMWVADMDFAVPQPVIDALRRRAEQGVFGYTRPTDAYFCAVTGWMRRRNGWEVAPEWICITPGVVSALYMMVRAFVPPGEKVLIQPPVYYPFFKAVEDNGRQLVFNPLRYGDGRYTMDFEDLERKTSDPAVKMAILCSPHNPVGRVWSREELLRFGEICLKNDVLVISDEIHSDLLYEGTVFTPFATISPEFAQNSIICTAASKTFNLAGLKTSNIIIPDAGLRAQFEKAQQSSGLFGVNAFGVVALEAAYNRGEAWLEQVMAYIEGNLHFLEAYIAEHIPQISVVRPEGTYLVWLDCRRLGLDKWALRDLMLKKARVYLDEGFIFGEGGEGFERINIACPRSLLAEALERICTAVRRL